jgi:hypothetical protein
VWALLLWLRCFWLGTCLPFSPWLRTDLVLSRLSHTTSLLAQLYFWTWTSKKEHRCGHCGHRPESPVRGIEAPGRDSDDSETCYEDSEDATLLKDEEA